MGLYWGHIGVILELLGFMLGLYLGYIGVMLGLCWVILGLYSLFNPHSPLKTGKLYARCRNPMLPGTWPFQPKLRPKPAQVVGI